MGSQIDLDSARPSNLGEEVMAGPEGSSRLTTWSGRVRVLAKSINSTTVMQIQDLVVPVLGMYAGQYFVAALPRTVGWGLSVIITSALLLLVRLRPSKERRFADPLQIGLGFLIGLPLALNVDNWKASLEAWQSITIWLVSCAVVMLGLLRQRPRKLNLSLTLLQSIDRIDMIIVGCLVAAALLLRVPDIETIPYYVDPDEASLARAALDSLTGVNKDPFTTGWATHPSLQFFAHALFIDAFGRTFLAMRLPSAIVGSLAVAALYLAARVCFGRTVGLIAGVLAAAADVGIHISRLGINNITDSLFALLVFGCFWLAATTGRARDYIFAGAILGLSQYYYFGARAIPFVVAAILLIWSLADSKGMLGSWSLILSSFLTALVVTEPLIGHFALDPGSISEHLFVTIPFTNRIAEEATRLQLPLLGVWQQRIIDSLGVFTVRPDTGSFYNSGQALLHPIEAPFFVLGLLTVLSRCRRPVYQGLLAWAVIILILGSVLMDAPDSFHRLLGLLPAGILVVAIGIEAGVETFGRTLRWPPTAVARFMAVVVVVVASVDISYYFTIYSNHIPDRNLALTGANVAALEYEQFHDQSSKFVIYSRDNVFPDGTIASQPILFVAGDAFLGGVPQTLDALSGHDRLYFYVFPDQAAEIPQLMARFPGGALREYRFPSSGNLLFTRYSVPGSD